jgi:hypothetical protein
MRIAEICIGVGLLGLAIFICVKYRNYVFKKLPMSALYIISIIGITDMIGYVWIES